MDLKQKLLDMAREATGDDEIVVAGDFQPKGMTWKVAAGAAAGSALGGAVSGGDVGQAIGTTGGMVAGRYAATSGALPPVVVLAASPSKLYIMTTNNGKGPILAKGLLLIDTVHRDNLDVHLKQRVTTRTAVITDNTTGHVFKLEGKRVLFHHMNDMLNALGFGADDGEDDDAGTEDAELAPVESIHPDEVTATG